MSSALNVLHIFLNLLEVMRVYCKVHAVLFFNVTFLFSGLVGPLMHIRQRVRFAVPGPENGGAADQSDGVCGYVHY